MAATGDPMSTSPDDLTDTHTLASASEGPQPLDYARDHIDAAETQLSGGSCVQVPAQAHLAEDLQLDPS